MSGEVIAFSDIFDIAIALSEDLKAMLNSDIQFQLLDSSQSLFEFTSKGLRTSEK